MRKKSRNLGTDDALTARLNAVGVHEVLFELHSLGGSVRVTALDPKSGTEVVVVCPSAYSEETMQRRAASKLAYVLEKNKGEEKGILA